MLYYKFLQELCSIDDNPHESYHDKDSWCLSYAFFSNDSSKILLIGSISVNYSGEFIGYVLLNLNDKLNSCN